MNYKNLSIAFLDEKADKEVVQPGHKMTTC